MDKFQKPQYLDITTESVHYATYKHRKRTTFTPNFTLSFEKATPRLDININDAGRRNASSMKIKGHYQHVRCSLRQTTLVLS